MERLDLPTLYRTIIVSSSSFQLLTDLDSSTAAMAQLHGHLEEGGALVMPFMTLWSEGDPTETDWELTGEATREDGALVRRWTWFRYDVETQLEHVEFRYEVTLDGQVIEEETQRFSPETRSYTQPQAVASYTAAGFEEVRVLEGFDRQHASKDARLCSRWSVYGGTGRPLLHRLIRHEVRPCDFSGAQTAYLTQREGDPGVERQHRVAAGEDQAQLVILDGLFALPLLRTDEGRGGITCRLDRELSAPSESAGCIDRLESPGRNEPGPRVARYAVTRPGLQRCAKRLLQGFLGLIEVSEKPDQSRQYAP